MKRLFLTGAAAVSLIGSASAATVFTLPEPFDTQIGGGTISFEFDTTIANAPRITIGSDNNVGVDASVGVVTDPLTANNLDGFYNGFAAPDGAQTITFTFSEPIDGFGATFAYGINFAAFPDGSDLSVTGDFDGTGDQTFSVTDNLDPLDRRGFFGIIGEANFDTITFTTTAMIDMAANGLMGQSFAVDDLNFTDVVASGGGTGNGGANPIPVPGALPLMMGGAALLTAARRRAR